MEHNEYHDKAKLYRYELYASLKLYKFQLEFHRKTKFTPDNI